MMVEKLREGKLMYDFGYQEDAIMNIKDSVRGIVKKQDFSGNLHIELEVEDEENDKLISVPAFGYWCGLVTPGTEVICSIKKWAKQGRDISVNVDHVEYESAA